MRAAAALVVALIAVLGLGSPTLAVERVEIRHGETILPGTLFRPAGDGPHPAIVALHGCGGLADPKGTLYAQYQAWGDQLVAAGFAVLFPDSFAGRGVSSLCRVQTRAIRTWRERVADANAARAWLQKQTFINPGRVSLLGWSNGAVTTLWAVRPRRGIKPKDEGPDFRSAAAFYPSCRRLGATGWSARVPTLILVGGADDWTPGHECEQMVAGARGRSASAQIISYPKAHHYFDRPNLPLQERSGLAFTPDGSGRAHVGTDTEARADAIKRVPEFLTR
ncbi:MAG: dienelactone hydrolase family protein [Microvirga sp.]